MAKVRIEGYLDYDAKIMHGDDPDAKLLFFQWILGGEGNLVLMDTEDIGDTIGVFRATYVEEVADD